MCTTVTFEGNLADDPRVRFTPAGKQITGDKRTAQRVVAEIVGPSLRWATTQITKTTRSAVTAEQQHDVSEHQA
jgi:single-stranded DNA-binding protein